MSSDTTDKAALDTSGTKVSGAQNGKKKNKAKGKFLHSKRTPTSSIEKNEINKLKERYEFMDPTAITKFTDIPLSKKTLKGLKDSGYEVPTEVQRESIPIALKGLDVLGAAQTGSGKTLAFVVPILERLFFLQWSRLDGLGALVITPTRELAYQIFETVRKVGLKHDFSAGLIIGGKDLNFERKRLDQCNIMICTPGRLLHHMDENPLFDCGNLQMLIIDEADRCLDLGFQQTMNGIIENLPPKRQTLLFSATQTKSVKDLARLSLKDPVYVSIHEHAQYSTPDSLRQSYIVSPVQNKIDILWSFVKTHKHKKIIVFLTCCKQVRFIHEAFTRLRPGSSVLSLYGTMHQLRRMAVYDEFCRKEHAVLFATDIAARGLDFPSVDWVIQMDCPDEPNSYIHRAGRTARYQKGGESLLVLLPSEEAMIEQLTQKKIPIEKIEVNPAKLQSIQRKLEAMLARDVELKQMAQRAFVTYMKAIFLMKDKTVFDVNQIDLGALARSYGLAVAPRVRFVQKQLLATGKAPLSQSSSRRGAATTSDETCWRRQDLEEAYNFHADDDEGENSDEDEDFMKIKRKDHELPENDTEEIVSETKKKNKILTKEKVAKRILAKNLKANQKVTFDDDGNRVYDASREKVSELGRALEIEASVSNVGGINLEEAKKALQEEDKFDRQLFREKIRARHREQRLKAKAERRLQSKRDTGDEDEESSDGEESVDDDVEAIIDSLPDPDRIYGDKKSDEDIDDDDGVYRGPPVAKKRAHVSDSEEDDTSDEDDTEDESDEEEDNSELQKKRTLMSRKRSHLSNSEENEDAASPEKAKRKWVKKKPPPKVKKPKERRSFDTGLDLALDEELALHLLSSKN